MTNGGDAAEMLVRLYLEGFEEVVKLSGKGIKELVPLLASTLKQESKSKGKARLTQMIKSGSPLKVFTFKNKDLKKFTEQAKRYGVLYTVLRDKNSKDPRTLMVGVKKTSVSRKVQRAFRFLSLLTTPEPTAHRAFPITSKRFSTFHRQTADASLLLRSTVIREILLPL